MDIRKELQAPQSMCKYPIGYAIARLTNQIDTGWTLFIEYESGVVCEFLVHCFGPDYVVAERLSRDSAYKIGVVPLTGVSIKNVWWET